MLLLSMKILSLFPLFLIAPVLVAMPFKVADQIKAEAEREWPDDYEMQVYTIKQEKEAYRQKERLLDNNWSSGRLKSSERAAFRKIVQKAEQKWPNNYQMQVYEIKAQLKAYQDLHD